MRVEKLTKSLILSSLAAILWGGCSFYHEKGLQEFSTLKVTYAEVRDKILVPRCLSCHTGGGRVSLQSFAEVKSHLPQIERMVLIEQRMPPGNLLNENQRSLLERWIRAGAPESDSGTLEPIHELKANFAALKKSVLEPKCAGCHSAGGTAASVPFNTLDDLLNSPRDLVIPGNVEESGLWIALTRSDSKRMPPASSGASPLSDSELAAVRAWIESGAPETEDANSVRIDNRWLSYNFVRGAVFAPKCIACHGSQGGVNLESYASLKSLLPAIQQATLVNQNMPRGGSLTENERKILSAWFEQGAPELPGGPPAPVNPPNTPPIPPVNDTMMNFAFVKERIFQPRCVSCHGSFGGVNLETYASVRANLARVSQAALVDRRMPPSGPLRADEQALLSTWIAKGAPEFTTPTPGSSASPSSSPTPSPGPSAMPSSGASPSPEPSPQAMLPTFSSIKRMLFEPKCLGCHVTGGMASGVPLSTLSAILASPRDLVLPGNPSESGLIIALERTDSDPRRMPPTNTGLPRLTAEQMAVVRKWIQDGAAP